MWENPKFWSKGEVRPDLTSLGPDFYSLHRANGHCVQAGGNSERVVGIAQELISGQGFLESIHVQDRVTVAKAIHDCLAHGKAQTAEFRMVHRDPVSGEACVRWFEFRCQAAPEAEIKGENLLALGVTRDISERRRETQRLQREREKSDSANIAKSRFLANMSHELRTPLNAILGFSELLQSDAMAKLESERRGEYLGLIHSSAKHLLTVVNDILDMSKIESGKYEIMPECFEFRRAVSAACSILTNEASKKGVDLRIGDMNCVPEVVADQRAIKQIVINLVSNAIKFSRDSGRVTVDARRRGRFVEMQVSDNGIGISAEHLSQLGQPFYQADSRYDRRFEGSGLGLSVVRGLVELHGGSLMIASEKDKGTTVTVSIPLKPMDTGPLPADEPVEVIVLKEHGARRGSMSANRTRKTA